MEKREFSIGFGKVNLNFYFSSDLVSQAEESLYKYWLRLVAEAISLKFYCGDHDIFLNINIASD